MTQPRFFILFLILFQIALSTFAAPQKSQIPLPKIIVDPKLHPTVQTLPHKEGEQKRLVAAVADAKGRKSEFVENELLVFSDDSAEVKKLVALWHGSIVSELGGEKPHLKGAPAVHLVSIDSRLANPATLPSDLRISFKYATGRLAVSSKTGLLTLAAAAHENARGLKTSLNYVLRNAALRDPSTTEAAESFVDGSGNPTRTFQGKDVPTVFYSNDATTWPYMRRNSPQDIDVAGAWRALAVLGKLHNDVDVLVLDSGIDSSSNPDFPPIPDIQPPGSGPAGGPGSCFNVTTGTSSPCPFHGTDVVMAGFAVPDNNFGAAGPGGPAARIHALNSPSSDLNSLVNYVEAIPREFSPAPKIINISAGFHVPAAVCLAICSIFDGIGDALRSAGILVFAAAMNEGRDVDDRDHFGPVSWESGSDIPCESHKVICVAGLGWNSASADPNSNYGSDHSDCCTVDLWGPYDVWMVDVHQPPQSASDPRIFRKSGTSFSAPFVAGVAALVWEANPGLSADEVEATLLRTAHWGTDPKVSRIVSAFGAVRDALGGQVPPYLTLTSPQDGASVAIGLPIDLEAIARSADGRDIGSSIQWKSDRDGPLGTGASIPFLTSLSEGQHRITASVTDSSLTAFDSRQISIFRPALHVQIIAPNAGSHFFPSDTIYLAGQASEPPATTIIPDTQVEWRIAQASDPTHPDFVGHGYHPIVRQGTLPAPARNQRVDYVVTLTATDLVQTTSVSESIQLWPQPVGPPPQVAIDSPQNGSSLDAQDMGPVIGPRSGGPQPHLCRANVSLRGHATDHNGAALTGTSLQWFLDSAVGSGIGTGEVLNATIMFTCRWASSDQVHIVLRAEDGQGTTNTAMDTFNVRIVP